MDGALVEHGHDLAHKVFGDEVSEGQHFRADQLHYLAEAERAERASESTQAPASEQRAEPGHKSKGPYLYVDGFVLLELLDG